MKLLYIRENPFIENDLLVEANVVNIKDPYNSISIAEYLKSYAENIPHVLKSPFVKKISRLLVNDERWHHAVRELPTDAPDWAHQAMEAGDLVFFQANQTLNSVMEHVTHYLSAAHDDQKNGKTNDDKVFATKELAGFPKIEDIDTLEKKSQEYFKRGSKKVKGNEDGMQKIMTMDGGFEWFLLQTADAFKRTGKTLQNCIGSYWTKDKADNQGMSIVVLRKENGEDVVAARIRNSDNEVQEMKGKNNKPPVAKYMTPVVQLVNKRKLEVGMTAARDFKNAGWLKIKGELITKAGALKKYVNFRPLGNTKDGYVLRRLGDEIKGDETLWELVCDVFKINNSRYASEAQKRENALKVLYQLTTDKGTGIIGGVVTGEELTDTVSLLHNGRLDEETSAADLETSKVQLLIKALAQFGLINDISPKLKNRLQWRENADFDTVSKTVQPIEKDIESKGAIKWTKISNPDRVKSIVNSIIKGTSTDYGAVTGKHALMNFKPVELYYAPMVSSGRESDDNMVNMVLVNKDNQMKPILYDIEDNNVPERGAVGLGQFHYGMSNLSQDKNTVNSIIMLANERNQKLPFAFRLHNHVVKTPQDKYEYYKPKKEKLAGTVPAEKYDISQLKGADKLVAAMAIATGDNIRRHSMEENAPENRGITVGDDMGLMDGVEQHFNDETSSRNYKDTRRSHSSATSITADWDAKDKVAIAHKVLGNTVPTAIYLVEVTYGVNSKHEAMLMVAGSIVTKVDNTTAKHQYQKFNDYDLVADQLNTFASENNLTFARDSMVKVKEFRVSRGKVISASKKQKDRVGDLKARGHIGTEGKDDIKFHDESKLVRMAPEQQAEWARKTAKIDTVPGEGWLATDDRGQPVGIVFVKGGNIMATFSNPLVDENLRYDKPFNNITDRVISKEMLPILNAGVKQFGWKFPTKNNKLIIEPDGEAHKILKYLMNKVGSMRDQYGVSKADINRAVGKNYAQQWKNGPVLRQLFELGIVKKNNEDNIPGTFEPRRSPRVRARMWRYRAADQFRISPIGQRILTAMHDGDSVDVSGMVAAKEAHNSWTPPAPKAAAPARARPAAPAPARAPRANAPAGAAPARRAGGSKAENALADFRAFITDNDRIPTRSEFIATLRADPYNMSPAGAQTYYYNVKKKYAAMNEKYSYQAGLELMEELNVARIFNRDGTPLI